MDFRLSEHEKELTAPLFKTLNECLILTQDYWSWDRESYFWEKIGTHLFNAVDFFSRTEYITVEEAKDKIKTKIVDLEREYALKKEDFYQEYPRESIRLKRWIETAGVVVGAHHYWASKCPRHHAFLPEMEGYPNGLVCGFIDRGNGTPTPPSTNGTSFAESSPKTDAKQLLNGTSDQPVATHNRLKCDTTWQKPDPMALMAPCKYVSSLPSKGIRSLLIDAITVWFEAPSASVQVIEQVIRYLHDASLVLDDIEDNSILRRGKPATHTIFGSAQATNSANFMFVQAVSETRKLGNSAVINSVLEGLEHLYLGQSWDLFWKHNLTCPTEKEYLTIVDNKTGGMFQMLTRLLRAESKRNTDLDLEHLMTLFGRFFQIRDDYMNLASTEYSNQKGFCEDLDEGKYSYLIVRLLEMEPELSGHINGIFRQRLLASQQITELPRESKLHILELMKDAGIFRTTLDYLKDMETRIEDEITRVEGVTGKSNPLLHLVVVRLSVMHLQAHA